MFVVCFLTISAFYTAHWQTYVTGSLRFGTIDVTEAQLAIVLTHALTGIAGDYFWALHVPVLNIEMRVVPAVITLIATASSLISDIITISKGGKGKNGSSVANTSIVFPAVPIVINILITYLIAYKSNSLYTEHTCLYTLTFGFIITKYTIKLIIAHMSKGEIFLMDWILTGPTLIFLYQYLGFSQNYEVYVLAICLIIASYDLLLYCCKVIDQICIHMNIYLFKIDPSNLARITAANATTTNTRKASH